MIINQIGYKKQIGILKRLTGHKFAYYQDTPKQKIWNSLNGGKDDVYIYDTEGKLVKHIKARGESSSYMGSGKEMCSDSDKIPVIKTLLEELKKIVEENDMKKCNDESNKDFKEIFKLRNLSRKKLKIMKKKKEGRHHHGMKKMTGGKKKNEEEGKKE